MFDVPSDLHWETARPYPREGDDALALQELELTLLSNPHNLIAHAERAAILSKLEQRPAVQMAYDYATRASDNGDTALLQQIWPHLVSGKYEVAGSTLETVSHLHPENKHITQLRSMLQEEDHTPVTHQ